MRCAPERTVTGHEQRPQKGRQSLSAAWIRKETRHARVGIRAIRAALRSREERDPQSLTTLVIHKGGRNPSAFAQAGANVLQAERMASRINAFQLPEEQSGECHGHAVRRVGYPLAS